MGNVLGEEEKTLKRTFRIIIVKVVHWTTLTPHLLPIFIFALLALVSSQLSYPLCLLPLINCPYLSTEVIREQKRGVDRSVRQLESERVKMKSQETKLIAEMKKMAKDGQTKSVKIMAMDLVRIRKHQEKFINLQAQLRAISLQMQTMSSQHVSG